MDKFNIRDTMWEMYWLAVAILRRMHWFPEYDHIVNNYKVRFPRTQKR